jgi:hypothetical protein
MGKIPLKKRARWVGHKYFYSCAGKQYLIVKMSLMVWCVGAIRIFGFSAVAVNFLSVRDLGRSQTRVYPRLQELCCVNGRTCRFYMHTRDGSRMMYFFKFLRGT